MTFHPRRRRPDDWKSSHARARADLSDRLDGVLDPSEGGWLDEHLASCAECRSAAASYDADRLALHALRDVQPQPPRDLWARTAAAIEHESRFRDRRSVTRDRRPVFRTTLAAALVVAVAVGVLSSSRLPAGGGLGGASPTALVAASTGPGDVAVGPTPFPISTKVHWIKRQDDGQYAYTTMEVREVCPSQDSTCSAGPPAQDQPVQITTDPESVFGSSDGKQLIVVGPGDEGGSSNSVNVVSLGPAVSPAPTDTPAAPSGPASPRASTAPSATPTTSGGESPSAPASSTPSTPAASAPVETPSSEPNGSAALPSAPATPSTAPSASPTEVAISPSPSMPGAVQIAKDVVLVGQSAAYSPSGNWFAFTARPVDGSTGPDIYVWRVGQPTARRVTDDHESIFGSWIGTDDMAVGSRVVDRSSGAASPATDVPTSVSFLFDPADGSEVPLPQTGHTWKPSVDPTGRVAVYWTGTLRRSGDPAADAPDQGSLVIGDWGTGDSAPSSGTPAAPQDQARDRHELSIADGRVADWDARWDPAGTKLAVWIADPNDPRVGSLSLYKVNTFDGSVDLKKPIIDSRRATAGFSISNGKLVWAEPAGDGSGANDRILVLAWTDDAVGTIETVPDEVVVIR